MDDYISISTLNDFIFCPYSIYLHNVYMDTNEGLYHAKPQTRGKVAHETVDKKTASNRKDDLLSLPVYSVRYKLMGKVDVYRKNEKLLVERKYQLFSLMLWYHTKWKSLSSYVRIIVALCKIKIYQNIHNLRFEYVSSQLWHQWYKVTCPFL